MKDPWMPTSLTFLPISKSVDMPQMVKEFVAPGGKWRKNVIEQCFNNEEALIILSMSLSKFGCHDRIIWHYTHNKMYSVKFGYMVAQEMNRNGELG